MHYTDLRAIIGEYLKEEREDGLYIQSRNIEEILQMLSCILCDMRLEAKKEGAGGGTDVDTDYGMGIGI